MNAIYLPSQGPESWRWLLAAPGKHWREGYSAMALAYAWEQADGWPSEVAAGLATTDALAGTELLLALPEHETPLEGGRRASQSDVLALGRTRTGEQLVIAVEGKVGEPFGTQTVSEWRVGASPGKAERLAELRDVLDLEDDVTLGGLRYQLLHRTAAAVIEARRFGARHALMLVHSFSASGTWFEDYAAFARALGAESAYDEVGYAKTVGGIDLHLGWVTGKIAPRCGPDPERRLTDRFDKAVQLARTLHGGQRRKGGDIPYLAHLLAVAALVIEDGGDEDEAIAGLLHDAVEDQGGAETLKQIGLQFGAKVGAIVEACSDTDEIPKPPWRGRKEAYIAHLGTAERSVLRVSLADKLHNARAILFDLRGQGSTLWDRFTTATAEDQLWYYGALADAFAAREAGPMAVELRRVVEEIRAQAEELATD